MWENVPYLDETTDPAAVTNSTEIYPMIIADYRRDHRFGSIRNGKKADLTNGPLKLY